MRARFADDCGRQRTKAFAADGDRAEHASAAVVIHDDAIADPFA
jgi:hypothetical protein